MVIQQARAAWRVLRNDVQDFLSSVTAVDSKRKLQTFHISLPGGKRRLHLRTEADGNGVLFVDAMDVIHLNQTAARIAQFALDKKPKAFAIAMLRRDGSAQANKVADDIYDLIDHLWLFTDHRCIICRQQRIGVEDP